MEARSIDYSARKSGLAKAFKFKPLRSLLITQEYLKKKLIDKKIVKEKDLEGLNKEEQSIFLNKKLFDFIGFSAIESSELSKQDIISTLLAIIEFNPNHHLFLSDKNKDKLSSVIIKLCASNNLDLIGVQITNFHTLLCDINTLEGLFIIKPNYDCLISAITFITDLLAYAKSQHVFINEKLDEALNAKNKGILARVDALSRKYESHRKMLQEANYAWVKSLQAPNTSLLKETSPRIKDTLDSSDLKITKDNITQLDNAVLDAIKTLIDQNLLLPIIHAQQEILRGDPVKNKEMRQFCGQITSENLFSIRVWEKRPAIIDEFLRWQTANPVVAGLRTTTALLKRIMDELTSLHFNTGIKKIGLSKKTKYFTLLLTTKNPHMRNIQDLLGLDKKIKQRFAFLQSERPAQSSSAPILHTRENSRALLLANAVEKEPKSSVPHLVLAAISSLEMSEQLSPTNRRIEHVRKPAADLRKEMAERRDTHVSLAQLRLSSLFTPPLHKVSKPEENTELKEVEEFSSSSSSRGLSENSSC